MNSSADQNILDYSIRPFREGDLPGIADAHLKCFPGHFLTSLGPGFVRFYYDVLLVRYGHGFAAIAAGPSDMVLGFAAGANSSDDFRRYLYRRHFFHLAGAILWRLAISPETRRFFLSRMGHVWQAFQLVFHAADRHSPCCKEDSDPDDRLRGQLKASATLMSMGVQPECRGSGVAQELIRAFECMVANLGFSGVVVSAFKMNTRAHAFYTRAGYRLVVTRREGVDFLKLTGEVAPVPEPFAASRGRSEGHIRDKVTS